MKVRFAVAPGGPLGDDGSFESMLAALEPSAFDGIWLSDVALTPTLDPLVGLAFAAARTTRLKLGANVVPLGRNPFLLAKAIAQLDRLSGGRVLLSYVPGIGMPEERAALGATGADRGAVLEELLEMARAWWAGKPVTRSSSGWSFDGVQLPVRPLQDPLEVWLGGSGPKALERAGRVADGWLGAVLTPSEAEGARSRIEESARASGRQVDPEHFGMSIAYAKSSPAPALFEAILRRRPQIDPLDVVPVGSRSLRSMLRGYLDAGLSKFVVRPLDVVSWNDELAWLSDAVLGMQS